MSGSVDRKVVLITRQTRLEELVARFHTVAQAKFYVEHLGADFSDYEGEHAAYLQAKRLTAATLQAHGRHQIIDRSFLPNFLFAEGDIVIALGQDGLVANTSSVRFILVQRAAKPTLARVSKDSWVSTI